MSQELQVRTYHSPMAYKLDAERAAQAGWFPIQVTEHRPRRGCLKLFFQPKPQIVVTYQWSAAPISRPSPVPAFPSDSPRLGGLSILGLLAVGIVGLCLILAIAGSIDRAFDDDDPAAIFEIPTRTATRSSAAANITATPGPRSTATPERTSVPAKTPERTSVPTKTPKPKPTATLRPASWDFVRVGKNDEKIVVELSEGIYDVDAECENTAMQVYVFEPGGDPNNQVLVTWPVSRSRLDEPAKDAIIPRDDDYLIEIYCTGDWAVSFEHQ